MRRHQTIHPPSARRTLLEIFMFSLLVVGGLMMVYTIGKAWAQPAMGSGVQPAEAIPNLDENPDDFLMETFKAVQSGNWTAVTAMVLIGIVWLARKPWALGRVAFFKTDRGGVIMALGLALVGGLGHAIAAAGKFPSDLATYKAIGMTAVTAMGGYVALKRLIWPAEKKQPEGSAPG
jgi:hypothetical protein